MGMRWGESHNTLTNMKKILQILVLIAASVIPGTGMAATNYGIRFDGTMINSDNCQNLTSEHLIQGSVKYDYSSNTLTLDNVYFNVDNESYFLNVTSSVKNGLKIVVKGYNYIGDCNGVAIGIHKPTNASVSSPNVYFQGDGVLALYKGEIETFDGPSLCFGKSSTSDTDGGLDIYARYITSRNSAGGHVWISDANLHLTGSTYGNGTFGGFTSVYMHNGIAAYSEDGKNKYSYGGASVLRDQNGNMVTGPAYIGYERYGLSLHGKEVTKGNYNRLNLADIRPCSGTFSYVPSTHTLNMTNAELNNIRISGTLDHYSIKNSIDGLKVNVTGTCKISENRGTIAVHSTGDITFQGTGNLTIRSSAGRAIHMAATGKTLAFNNLTAYVQYGGINCNGGTLSLSRCTLDVNGGGVYVGGIKNTNQLICSYAAITTSGVYYDQKNFYKVGSSSPYTGTLSFKPVSNYYGIMVCGVELTEYNYNSVAAPYIESGSVTYDPSANELTLNNLTIDTKERGAFSALTIYSGAKSGMKIKLVGHNVIKKTNGAAVVFQEPSNSTSVSNPHYYIDGTGSLVLEESGILCFGYCNLCFGSGLQGGQGLGGCTIDAQYLQSKSAGQGRIWFTDCMMTLRGYGLAPTIYNFANVFTSSHCIVRTPENGYYNTSDYYLADASGNKVTGEIYIGWQKYGLKICGVEVNEIIKDHIQDLINPTPCIQNINSSGSHPAYDCFKYDPSTKTLYMKNVYINDTYNKADPHAVCIENTGDELHIQCEGTNRIAMSRGNTAAIYSTKSLEFRGSGSLQVYASTDNAIEMAGDDQYLKFYYCNTEVDGFGGYAINTDGGNKFRLYVEKANVTIKGSVHGIACYELTNAAISTPEVFVQPANDTYAGCFRKFDRGEYFGETVFKPTTTSYGILVGGHELNDVTCNNFYFDDITKGTITYNARINTLTLNNVTANCTQMRYVNGKVVKWNSNGINIKSSAPDNLHINLVGNNVFHNIDGVGFDINKNTVFEGNGTINVGQHSITCDNGANITLTGYCTLIGQQLYGFNDGGGAVSINDGASLYLSGKDNGFSTIRGLADLYTNGYATGQSTPRIISPNRAWYDNKQKKLVTHIIDGEKTVYGPVTIAPTPFCGIIVQGIDVSGDNCNDIFRDIPHEGTMRYDSLSHTLYMENFKLAGTTRTVGIEEYTCGRTFHINLSGENEVSGFGYLKFKDDTRIESTDAGKLTFNNNFGTTIYPANDLSFTECTVDGISYIECRQTADNATDTQLSVWASNLSLSGNYTGNPTISGFSGFHLYNAEVVEPSNYTDTHSGAVIIEAVERYGIHIGNTEITSRNKDDVYGDGTVRLDPYGEEGEYLLYLTDARLHNGIYLDNDCPAEILDITLQGNSSITVDQETCIYSGVSVNIHSTDGQGKLTLDTQYGTAISLNEEWANLTIADCEVDIYAGMYGITGPRWWNIDTQDPTGAPTYGNDTNYPVYLYLTGRNHEAKLTVDTEKYHGDDIFWGIGVFLQGNYEILQPADCIYENLQLLHAADHTPYSQAVAEITVKPIKISVEDITRLIDMYLEPYSNITVEDITNLIDRYLEQE